MVQICSTELAFDSHDKLRTWAVSLLTMLHGQHPAKLDLCDAAGAAQNRKAKNLIAVDFRG